MYLGQKFLDYDSKMFSLLRNYKAIYILPEGCERSRFACIFTGVASCGFFSPFYSSATPIYVSVKSLFYLMWIHMCKWAPWMAVAVRGKLSVSYCHISLGSNSVPYVLQQVPCPISPVPPLLSFISVSLKANDVLYPVLCSLVSYVLY